MFSRIVSLCSSTSCPNAKSAIYQTISQNAKKLAHSNMKLCSSSSRGYSDSPIDHDEAKKNELKRKVDIQEILKFSHPLSKKGAAGISEEKSIAASRKPSADMSIKKKFFNFDPSTERSPADQWEQLSKLDYQKVDEGSSRVIYDITEHMLGISDDGKPLQSAPLEAPSRDDLLSRFNLKRGKSGVFDLEDLVELLYMENARDLVAIKIPAKLHFVDHMVIITAKSQRHLNAMAATVRKVYNAKMDKKSDHALILEGRDTDWVAMDLGNIALHVMSPAERKRVDIESLWLCGPEHDLKLQQHAEVKEDDLFSLVDPIEEPKVEAQPYDITKLYDHPYKPVWADEVLPDIEDINDENRNTYTATSIVEIALRKHNKEHARKFRGRFRK